MQLIAKTERVAALAGGLMFDVERDARIWPAFIVYYEGSLNAYLNVCPHIGLRLNASKNDVLCPNSKGILLCRSHGARYDIRSGLCLSEQFKGLSLIRLAISEQGDNVYLDDERYRLIAGSVGVKSLKGRIAVTST